MVNMEYETVIYNGDDYIVFVDESIMQIRIFKGKPSFNMFGLDVRCPTREEIIRDIKTYGQISGIRNGILSELLGCGEW
jgi:hypothetical protein